MSDSFVTQCPHCRTSFRVSQVQLAAARGAVRCGACLHVFNAHQHMLAKPATAATSPPIAAQPTAEPARQQPANEHLSTARKNPLDTAWIHDDLDLDSLDLDEELARLEQEEQSHSSSISLTEASPVRPPHTATATTTTSDDERWAELLLAEPGRNKATPPAVTDAEALTEPAQSEPPQAALDDRPGQPPAPPTIENSNNKDDTADTRPEEPVQPEIKPAPESHTATGFRANENLLELSDDPLQLQWQAPSKPWGRWIGWGLLNLLAASTLAIQYSIYHFDELARQDTYRSWFENACPLIGCTLPPKVDVTLIKSSNLVVRSHPDFAGALVVDAILYNRASFAQPFPLLELRFSDINNKLLANRRFKPSEYLAGELAGQSEMPPQTPIHISLDILDPGQEAVNYSLTFQSPE